MKVFMMMFSPEVVYQCLIISMVYAFGLLMMLFMAYKMGKAEKNLRCYRCRYVGLKSTFSFTGTEMREGHEVEKYKCPKCEEIHWSETRKSYELHSK